MTDSIRTPVFQIALITILTLIASITRASGLATVDDPCPKLVPTTSGIGDYRDKSVASLHHLGLVEGAHFTKQVRQLKGGNGGTVQAELNYVLNHFPNHHHALSLVSALQLKTDYNPQVPMRPSYFWPDIECYIARALSIAPDDSAVHLIQAIHYHQINDLDKAEQSYLNAIKISPGYIEAHYNLGLLYMDQKKFDTAKFHAKQAYAGGYPIPGLKNRLQAAGIPLH